VSEEDAALSHESLRACYETWSGLFILQEPWRLSQGAAACLAVASLIEACILVRIHLLSMDGVAMALRPKLEAG